MVGLGTHAAEAVAMAFPRYVAPDLNTFFTRVTRDQRFFFAPSPEINHIFGYLLALMSERYGIGIHAASVMADHVHVELTDRRGNLPAALQWFGSLTARAVNRVRGRKGTVYEPSEPPNLVYPRCEMSVADRIAYTMTNPVHHGAVRHARDYPGLAVQPDWYLEPRTFERPSLFRDLGHFPETATLHLDLPDDYAHLTRAQFVDVLRQEVDTFEANIHAKRVREGTGYMGPSRCRKLDWRQTAKKPHAPDTTVREVIARERAHKRLFRRMLREFRRAYQDTRARWLDGHRDIEWPQGTWKMCRRYGFPMAGGARALAKPPP